MKSRVQLKNVKYSEWASQETNCFQATVYIDGKKVGSCQNEGSGGPTSFFPEHLVDTLNQIAKEELKPEWTPPEWGESIMIEPDAEILVDKLLCDHLIERDIKKTMKKYVLFTKKGQKGVWQKKGSVAPESGEVDLVLNSLPLDEIVEIFKQNA